MGIASMASCATGAVASTLRGPCPPPPVSTAPSSPSRAATGGCSRRRPRSGADVVMLDLEDAVAPDDKEQARENVIAALRDLDWSAARSPSASTGSTPTGAIATSSTSWSRRRQARHHPDPKVACAGDIHLVATLLSPDRGARAAHADRDQPADRDGARECTRRRDRRGVPGADGGDDLRRRRLRRLDAEPDDLDRRLDRRLRGAHGHGPGRGRTGATSGITRSRGSPWPAGPTACGRSTARSATSATARAT